MKIDKKFIVNLQGKEFITFTGLLDAFFVNEGKSIETTELENSTIEMPKFKATVNGKKGTFTGHGDSNKENVNALIAKHKYRMAETRAIARALRLYNNIGMCSKDELGGDDKSKSKEDLFEKAKTMVKNNKNVNILINYSKKLKESKNFNTAQIKELQTLINNKVNELSTSK